MPESRDSVTTVLGPDYDAGAIHRLFFGSRYRRIWTTPVRVPVLDLSTFAGGLTPTGRGGGMQTASLRLRGADGREYAFRSVDKDPTAVLPPELRETFARDIVQDQISSAHPLGALVVPPILDAVGVLHAVPILVRMPDDPRLGEFRAEFAGMNGIIEERPDDDEGAAFAGAREVISTEDMLDALEANPHGRVDARTFLAARLVDVFLGDWDRHQDQWRWARFSQHDTAKWLPIPRDRDQAFVRFDGLLLAIARRQVPQLIDFGDEYGSILGATWNGRDLDRTILPMLEWPAWDSVATALQRTLTDDVLEDAVSRLPAAMQAIESGRMLRALRARRDAIPGMAQRYYEHLAGEVDVWASDRDENARIVREDGGAVLVTLVERLGDGRDSAPFFTRRFHPDETDDVRIYLRGGDDRAVVTGTGGDDISVRLIGGGDDDVLADSSRAGGVHFYDDRGDNSAIGAGLDRRSYEARTDTSPNALPHRDWGHRTITWLVPGVAPDAGFTLAWTGTRTGYAFRHQPFASSFSFHVEGATGARSGRASITGTFFAENSRRHLTFDAAVSGIEVLNFYGLGNETEAVETVDFYRVSQTQARLFLLAGVAFGNSASIAAGPVMKFSRTSLDGRNADRFIATAGPFGTGDISQLGVAARASIDTRDVPANATRGILFAAAASHYFAAAGLDHALTSAHAEAATFLSADIPTQPVLALFAEGRTVNGDFPFYEAAFLGGRPGSRAYRSERFAGDGLVAASAELRLELTHLALLIPGTQGVFGFYETGRVFLDGEDSDTWHNGYGGGLWFSALGRGNLLRVSGAKGDEGTRIYVGVGFTY